MKNALSLYRVLTKNSAMKMPKGEGKGRIYLSLGIIALCCIMIPCCIIVGYVSNIITEALLATGSPEGGLLLEIHIMSAFSMIFGILVIFSVLFFSSDREHLMPLPFKNVEILAAKFMYSYMAESVMEFLVLFAMFIGFFTAFKLNVISVIASVIGVILIPLLPLLYCAVLGLIIMSVMKNVKSRKLFNHLSTVILLAFVALFLISLKDIGNLTMDNYIASLSSGSNVFSNVLSKIFFTVPFLLKAIVNSSIVDLLIYIGLNLAAFAIMLLLGHCLYGQGLYAVGTLGTKKDGHLLINKSCRKKSLFSSYLAKEFKVLLRTRAYSGNCIFINLLWPAGLALFLHLNNEKEGFSKIISYYLTGNAKAFAIVTMAVVVISFIASALNSLASTAFTREGAHIDIIHYLPVDYKTQIKVKELVAFIGTYPALAISVIIWCIFAHCSPIVTVFYLLLALGCFYVTTSIGLYLDSSHPHIQWDDEYSALRGNLNTFFDMAVVMVISVLICAIPFIVFNIANLSLIAFISVLSGLLLLLVIICLVKSNKLICNNLNSLR